MARNVPASIQALVGQKNLRAPIWLMKWELNTGTKYYSSGQHVTYAGNVYEANRLRSIPSFEAGLIDRKRREFSKLTIQLEDLPNVGSTTFPFVALDALEVFEDKRITIYCYSPDANDAVLFWWGWSGRPTFNTDHTVDLTASFFWDSIDLPLPTKNIQQVGFRTLRKKRKQDEEAEALPIVYGAGDFFIRPVIYRATEENGYLLINFIISSTTAGGAFDAGDIQASNIKLFGITPATSIELHLGGAVDTAPANLGRFPDGEAHNFVCYGYATFPITDQIKDRIDDLEADDIRMRIGNGRKLISTSLPSANPVRILEDILRDPNNSIGLGSGDFDSTAVTSAASYVGSRYATRYELPGRLDKPLPMIDMIQRILGDFHGYITFDNGQIQINCKRNNETAAAVFATTDSGISGRLIHNNDVKVWEKDSSEVVNKATIQYFNAARKKRTIILTDSAAQTRAGGTMIKVVDDDFQSLGLTDEDEVTLNGAITMREEQNGNLFCEFAVPLFDAIGISPGQVIEVRSPKILNNASNKDFRVIKQSIDTGEEPLITLTCQIYKTAIYNDSAEGLGVDILRGESDTSAQGRPPDVTPDSLAVVDTGTNDTEGQMATLRATCTFPAVNLATEQAEGTFRQLPWAGVQLWWHYTTEPVHKARLGLEIKYTGNGTVLQVNGEFQVDFHKNKSVQVHFVAIGHNRSRAPLGYIPDPTKASHLTAPGLTATALSGNVAVTTAFTVDDFAFIEKEVVKVASKTGSSLTFVGSGSRTAQFDTQSIAHPAGTEIAVAKLSYPSLIVSLTTPRFPYPVVTGVVARKRDDGVRIKWADVSADNQEKYLLYWSTDADAGSNVNKLGSATPSWYTTDPETPPAGVNLVKVDSLAYLILHEDIGAIGTTVRARVAARNRKNSYSATLSALGSNTQLGDAAAANWVANTNQATPTQAGIVFAITKKHCGGRWDIPGFLTNGTAPPTSRLRYRVFVRDGSALPDLNNVFLNPKDPANPVGIANPGAFFDIETNEFELRIRRKDYAAIFRNNGLRLSIAAINTVNGVETVGPLTQYTAVVQIGADPAEGDTDVAGAPSFELIEFYGAIHVHVRPPSTNGNTVLEYQVALVATTAGSATTPTSADPPLAGSVNDTIKKIVKSDGFVSLGSPKATRWVFARCRNTESPATGGPGNNGWSAWSAGQSVATARPIQDFIGDGVPDVPTSGNTGSTNFDGTGTTGGTPIRQWLDGDTLEDVLEIILPTGQNAFSLTAIDVEIVRKNNGAVKFRSELPISTTPVYRFRAPSSYNPMARVRFRNMFREGGSDGWSAWSKYVQCKQSTDAATYDPGASPPPTGDIFSEGNYPGRYNLF